MNRVTIIIYDTKKPQIILIQINNNNIDSNDQHLRLVPRSSGQTNITNQFLASTQNHNNNLHQNVDSINSTHENSADNNFIQQSSFNSNSVSLNNIIPTGVSNNNIIEQNIFAGPISNNNNMMNVTHQSSQNSNNCQNDQILISRQQLQDIFNRQFELTAMINNIINK
ncbi:4803_t:CDS:2 [Entrophospora sp. SA101]|nr:4803_t:CDS:2 [Entrophospora sp. SA101]